jgi:prepilin-type N-terminal cleavage/methylation domain-containing protein/prepilin-type processing-associated H-X9-DG protein
MRCRWWASARSGFTLIELLVVIAIIAILAAILFPVFAQARDKARSSACLSNTKQMGTAITMYAQDYDETLPRYWDSSSGEPRNGKGNDNPNPLGYWHNQIQPYIKNYNVFICPSATTAAERSIDTGEGTPADRIKTLAWRGSGSYGWNFWYLGAWVGQTYTLAQVTYPSECIAIGEMYHTQNAGVIYPPPLSVGTPDYNGWTKDKNARKTEWTNFAARHQGGNNLVFVDGHSKWYRKDYVENHPELFYSIRP